MDVRECLRAYDALLESGRRQDAENYLKSCLEAAEAVGNKGAMLTFYNEMEGMYRTTGRAAAAAKISDRALELVRVMGLTGSMFHGTTLLNGATANRQAGNLSRALSMYQEAEQIFIRNGQENSYPMTALCNNISQVYQDLNRKEEALAYLKKALSLIRRFSQNPEDLATTYVNMGLLAVSMGDREQAKQCLKEAGDYYMGPGKEDPHRASYFSAMGDYFTTESDWIQAEHYYNIALESSLSFFGENDACGILRKKLDVIRDRQRG